MRILITGGRSFADQARVWAKLSELHATPNDPITCVIHGGATGADSLAGYWAYATGVHEERCPADWDDLSHPDAIIKTTKFGKKYDARAGVRRNQQMLDDHFPDFLLAFPGGTGTADMVRRAKAAGLEVILG